MKLMPAVMTLMALIPMISRAELSSVRSLWVNINRDSTATLCLDAPSWSGSSRFVCARSFKPWSVMLITDNADTLTVDIGWGSDATGSFDPVSTIRASVRAYSNHYTNQLRETDKFPISKNDYLITLGWDLSNGLTLKCNNRNFINPNPLHHPIRQISVSSDQEMCFSEWLTRCNTTVALAPPVDTDIIMNEINSSTDSITGVYEYLDRDIDPHSALLGGSYRLAVIPAQSPGDYMIYYLDGASTNNHLWKPGMAKGLLSATPFQAHFNLVWVDAMFVTATKEQYASFPGNGLMELAFSLYKSKIRLVRTTKQPDLKSVD